MRDCDQFWEGCISVLEATKGPNNSHTRETMNGLPIEWEVCLSQRFKKRYEELWSV